MLIQRAIKSTTTFPQKLRTRPSPRHRKRARRKPCNQQLRQGKPSRRLSKHSTLLRTQQDLYQRQLQDHNYTIRPQRTRLTTFQGQMPTARSRSTRPTHHESSFLQGNNKPNPQATTTTTQATKVQINNTLSKRARQPHRNKAKQGTRCQGSKLRSTNQQRQARRRGPTIHKGRLPRRGRTQERQHQDKRIPFINVPLFRRRRLPRSLSLCRQISRHTHHTSSHKSQHSSFKGRRPIQVPRRLRFRPHLPQTRQLDTKQVPTRVQLSNSFAQPRTNQKSEPRAQQFARQQRFIQKKKGSTLQSLFKGQKRMV